MTLAEKLLKDMNRGISYHFDEEKFLKTVVKMFGAQKEERYPGIDMSYHDYREGKYNQEVSECGFEVYDVQTTNGPKPALSVHSELLDEIMESLSVNGFKVRDYCNAKQKRIRLF